MSQISKHLYRPLLCVIGWYSSALLMSYTLLAQEGDDPITFQELHLREAIIFTGSLNADCYADTVLGYPDLKFNYLPYQIRWGRPGQTEDSASAARCLAGIPLERRVPVTFIQYPEWASFSGSVTFQPVNQDSLNDMTLFVWGSIGNGAAKHDTIRPVVIFAQSGLDTLAVINVGDIRPFQTSPFSAMDLRLASELVQPSIRDLSGKTSYELEPVVLYTESHSDSMFLPTPTLSQASGITSGIRAYPNPAAVATQVSGTTIPAGYYLIEIVSANGEIHLQQQVSIATSGELLETIGVEGIPNGYYLVRLRRHEAIVSTYPIIITR